MSKNILSCEILSRFGYNCRKQIGENVKLFNKIGLLVMNQVDNLVWDEIRSKIFHQLKQDIKK
jgi:hypothetical protein